MNWKKNKLIIVIMLAMVLGIAIGYVVNISISNNKFTLDRSYLNKIQDP
jgi:uncharacterized membrane-anchored protein YhcB (DUF1043 family)